MPEHSVASQMNSAKSRQEVTPKQHLSAQKETKVDTNPSVGNTCNCITVAQSTYLQHMHSTAVARDAALGVAASRSKTVPGPFRNAHASSGIPELGPAQPDFGKAFDHSTGRVHSELLVVWSERATLTCRDVTGGIIYFQCQYCWLHYQIPPYLTIFARKTKIHRSKYLSTFCLRRTSTKIC